MPRSCRAFASMLVVAAALLVGPHVAIADQRVAPNGVRCTAFVPNISPGYSCLESMPNSPGTRCSGYVPPDGSPTPGPLPPMNFGAGDIARPGVPKLTPSELRSVRAAQRRLHSSTIRFVFLPYSALPSFVVFDATDGPCYSRAGGYQVLNTWNRDGRLFYQPGENPYTVMSLPP